MTEFNHVPPGLIFEADFRGCSYGYRPRRHAHQAIDRVTRGILQGLTRVVDVDLSGYFDNIRHHLLLEIATALSIK